MKRDLAAHSDGAAWAGAGDEAAGLVRALSTTTTAAVSSGVGWPATTVRTGGPALTEPTAVGAELLELSEP